MLLNWTTQIEGEKIVLVPYCRHHVPKYHQWMKSPELQHLTGSEPLTLEEEFQMQQTWRDSPDKCTFIVIKKGSGGKFESRDVEIESMVGDTNIFIRTDEDTGKTIGEVEIMIAEPSARGQKLGWEAMLIMIRYGIEVLKIDEFEAKIKMDNSGSIGMFRKLLFRETGRSEVFQEVTLTASPTDDWKSFVVQQTPKFLVQTYSQD